ncbi:MAG: nucleotidyltransferase family protein [Bacteroidaceae bacterium]|nr:nucleotidyltransferase family protein [Bacteroidaceae bacterium]
MSRIEELFFYILSAVVKDAALDAPRFNAMTPEEWTELFRLSKMQGVTAVVFEKLSAAFDECEDFPRPPKALTLNWYAQSQSIERKMVTRHKRSAEFAGLMVEKGLQTLVLKGIAVSSYYPNPLHREFGDLDCYLFEGTVDNIRWGSGYEKGNFLAEDLGADVRRGHYKHSHVVFKKQEIENHQYFLPIRGSRANKALEKQLRKCVEIKGAHALEGTALLCPNADFNALFLSAHAINHFLYESVKVRHLLDWALFLKVEQENVDWDLFWTWCDKMHFSRFVRCLHIICEKYLGLRLPQYPGQTKEMSSSGLEDLAERVLADILTGDNVYNKGNSNLMVRLNLVKNFFASAWKYHRVVQKCMLTDLVRQVTATVWDKHPTIK